MRFNVQLFGLMALLLIGMTTAQAQPDAFGYTATDRVAYSYVNIASTGTSVLADADDGSAVLTIPFGFRFYGVNYTSLCVSSNALISFGSCVTNDFNNLDLTSQSPPSNQPLIAPFWSDLTFGVPGAGTVVYQAVGTAPARRFILQWNNVSVLNVPGALNFQTILHEGTNALLFQYQAVESSSAAVSKGASATVGIRGSDGHRNNHRLQWSYRAPVLSNSSAIQFTAPGSAAPVDISSRVRATTSAFVFSRVTNLYTGTVTIANTSATSIPRPISIVLTALTPGVTALNATGTLPTGEPFYIVPGSAALGAGQSAVVPVQFRNPSNARIAFVVRTYAGSF